jgi:hypothetical protein
MSTETTTFPVGHAALSLWFELSYAQFLTVPRLVLEAMPDEWQGKLAALMEELDATIDWRPRDGRYYVRLRDANGRFTEAPLWNYRYGSVEGLRRPPLPETTTEGAP